MQAWKDVHRDEIQEIINEGYWYTLEDAKIECFARKLMCRYRVDHAHAISELKCHHGDVIKVGQTRMEHAKTAKEQLKFGPVIPARDTWNAPNVTTHTRIISVLRVDESNSTSNIASPGLGDEWLVSDFYARVHVLDGMGRSQEWVNSMAPGYLIEKYGREDNPIVKKTVQTKWSSGFIHGDPFKTRKLFLMLVYCHKPEK